MARASAAPPAGSPAPLRAPLFRELIEKLEETDRRVVLDLGAASTSMLSLLGRSRCRVEIADLAADGGIERLNREVEGEDRVAVAESLLPRHQTSDAVDLVFCWDLLDYLTPAAIGACIRAIERRARPGAYAHALVVYSEKTMPATPGRFVPDAELGLVNYTPEGPRIASRRYSPEDLQRFMGGFLIESARLLGNGMQEFLFRLD